MGCAPSLADPDFWMKNAGDHYKYIATYVDDVLALGRDPLGTINEIKKTLILKGIGSPVYYLGGDLVELEGTWNKEGIYNYFSAKT